MCVCMSKTYLFLFPWTFHWVWVLQSLQASPPTWKEDHHPYWGVLTPPPHLWHWNEDPGKGVPPAHCRHPSLSMPDAPWPRACASLLQTAKELLATSMENKTLVPKAAPGLQPAARENALLKNNEASQCFQHKWRLSAAKAMMTSCASCQEAMWDVTLRIKTCWHPAPALSTCASSHQALFSQMYQALPFRVIMSCRCDRHFKFWICSNETLHIDCSASFSLANF